MVTNLLLGCCSHSGCPPLQRRLLPRHTILEPPCGQRLHASSRRSPQAQHLQPPQPALVALGAALLVSLVPGPAEAVQLRAPIVDEYTEYKNIIKQRTGGSLPRVQSYKSFQKPAPSIIADPNVQLAAERRRVEQLTEKIKEMQSSRDNSKPILQQSSVQPREVQVVSVTSSPPDTNSIPSTLEESGSIWSVMNVVGVAAAGILAGLLLQMKKSKEELEAELKEELQTERLAVVDLREKVTSISSIVDEEKELVVKLKRESAELSSSTRQKIENEQKQKAALEAEKRRVERDLAEEQKLVEASRKEASIIRTSLEAEKAAKDTLQSKLDYVQSNLSETEIALNAQRVLAQKIGETAAQTKAELVDTKRRSTRFMLESANLQDSLVSEQNKRSIAESRVSSLTHELQEAGARLSAASQQVRKANEENVAVNDSVNTLKEECAQLSYSLQLKVKEAADVKRDAELKLEQVASERETKSEEVSQLRKSLEDARRVVDEGEKLIAELKQNLEHSKQETKHVQDQMVSIESRLESTDDLLRQEKESSNALQESNTSLMKDLSDLKQGFEDAVNEGRASKKEAEVLRGEMEELKVRYTVIGDRLEEEQDGLMAVKKQTQILSKQIQDLQRAKKRAEVRSVELEADLNAANQALEAVSKERAARERALRKAAQSIESERPMVVVKQEEKEGKSVDNEPGKYTLAEKPNERSRRQ